MTKAIKRLALVLLLLIMTSCGTPWRVTYLEGAVNQATQDDVAKRLGPPHTTRDLNAGGSVWSYQYRSSHVYEGTGGTSCTEYILAFDRDKILREWSRQRC